LIVEVNAERALASVEKTGDALTRIATGNRTTVSLPMNGALTAYHDDAQAGKKGKMKLPGSGKSDRNGLSDGARLSFGGRSLHF